MWRGVNCVLDVGNVSRETMVKICVDDTLRGSVMLLSWRYGSVIERRSTRDDAWYGWWRRVVYERSGMFHVKQR